jgi:hypothetical protein
LVLANAWRQSYLSPDSFQHLDDIDAEKRLRGWREA